MEAHLQSKKENIPWDLRISGSGTARLLMYDAWAKRTCFKVMMLLDTCTFDKVTQ